MAVSALYFLHVRGAHLGRASNVRCTQSSPLTLQLILGRLRVLENALGPPQDLVERVSRFLQRVSRYEGMERS